VKRYSISATRSGISIDFFVTSKKVEKSVGRWATFLVGIKEREFSEQGFGRQQGHE
jgi:hypothetical protein